MNYSTIPTVVGASKLRNASLLEQKVNITKIAFGDGDGVEYEPTGQETALKKQVYECPPNRIEEEAGAPTWIELEAVIPHNVGGWYLREVGCFDDEGDLIFIGNLPSSFKPSGESGVIKDLVFEMVYDAVAADVVQIKIDPNVVTATRKYVDDELKKHDDLNKKDYERKNNAANNDNIDSESLDEKHIKLPQLWRAFSNKIKSASTSVSGIVSLSNEISSNSETKAATPKAVSMLNSKLTQSLSMSLDKHGYFVFPDFLGGLIVQWGSVHFSVGGSVLTVSLPTAFPNEFYTVYPVYNGAASSSNPSKGVTAAIISNSSFYIHTYSGQGGTTPQAFHFLAVGR